MWARSNATSNDDTHARSAFTHVSTSHLDVLNNEMSVSTVDAFTYALGAQTTFRLHTVPRHGRVERHAARWLATRIVVVVRSTICANGQV